MASESQSDVSSSQKNTIELQAISLKESSTPRSAQSMTAVESSASGELVTAKPIRPGYTAPVTDDSEQPAVWHSGQSEDSSMMPKARPTSVRMVAAPHPVDTFCTNCGKVVVTVVDYESGSCTYVTCIALVFIGCALGCCLVPFFVDSFKDAYHKCPRCYTLLGKYKRL